MGFYENPNGFLKKYLDLTRLEMLELEMLEFKSQKRKYFVCIAIYRTSKGSLQMKIFANLLRFLSKPAFLVLFSFDTSRTYRLNAYVHILFLYHFITILLVFFFFYCVYFSDLQEDRTSRG